MKFSFKPLWKLLIDKEITNKELMERAKISKSTFYKLKNDKNVTTDVLLRICTELDCDISNIIECIKDNRSKKE
ncbi:MULTISPECIES: helix-turn-helix transcriptional regulator [unclassified Mycoplasma]|uniref:helix-turn-helix domain-containing protein n=1 Tax=unclassified Mycoplasma TaxID=2683645 RepID=UPI00211BED05|nr:MULTISPECIES: helix-turn-helix transcriptional regulator [unclassified Mycoplasma]UUM19791.1 helix-turn-helix transcriptional regulator [Mycoplasma sp. 1578d]UUM24775.1 helix-turn-helix transcriptional regulator [Mycoplasma sp. 3686d]